MSRALVVLILAGCGRIDFGLHHDAAVAPHDGRVMDVAGDGVVDAGLDASLHDIGCSDGAREGFVDMVQFPSIAGCAATWVGVHGMRDAPTGVACGDDLGPCAAPVDACAAGWHVCASSGIVADLTSRVTGAQCANAGGVATGEFNTAAQHCESCSGACSSGEVDCTYAASYGCSPNVAFCTEPVCCGPDCQTAQNCRGAAFAAPDTHADVQPCGAQPANSPAGVLCCTN